MFITRFCKLVTLIIAIFLICSCGKGTTVRLAVEDDDALRRADPGQAQWLAKQSMLGSSAELAEVVMGSNLSWLASSVAVAHSSLFPHADVWLEVDPTLLVTSGDQGAFGYLRTSAFWQVMKQNNIRGLYIAPIFSAGSSWSGTYYTMDNYDDPVSFKFSDAAGTDSDYFALLQIANKNSAIIGTSIVPMATGIGPDFFLAARNMRNYPGIYCMAEVPQELWENLPEAKSEWDVKALGADQVKVLDSSGLLASIFVQEGLLRLPGGWAATGEVRGLDGVLRRYVYRYYQTPRKAVVNWTDPSAAGRQIVSGSIVRTTGELGVAFSGVSFLALTGLTPYENSISGRAALEPGLTAASDVGQEIRRYAGWSYNTDELTLAMLQEFMQQRVDFTRDSIMSTGAGHALVTGDAKLLRESIDALVEMNVDISRLVHCLPGSGGVNYKNGIPGSRPAYDELLKFPGVSNLLKDGRLHASGAALAAIGSGHSAGDELSDADKLKIKKGHQTLAFFMAAQPGLFILPAHDAVGALPDGWLANEVFSPGDQDGSPAGGVSLLGERKRMLISKRGIAASPALYNGLDIQNYEDGSFLKHIGKLASMREQTGVAGGRLLGRVLTSGKGVVVLATELPDNKGVLLAVSNFNQRASNENIRLSAIPGGLNLKGGKAKDALSGQALSIADGAIGVSLNGWDYRAILIQTASSSSSGSPSEPEGQPLPGLDAGEQWDTPVPATETETQSEQEEAAETGKDKEDQPDML